MPAVLITGANRGIGLEFARQYAADGWEVIATARETSAELDGLGVRVESLDMRDLGAVASFGKRMTDVSLDLLIANAGTDHPKRSDTTQDAEAWVDMMRINSIAPFMLAKALLERMRSPGGRLIAISSQMGSIADNRSGGSVPYRTSKAALNAAWRSLAIDVKPFGIVAAMFHPGWVQTRMGGDSAPFTTEQSAEGLFRGIQARPESGKFWNVEVDGLLA